MPASPDYSGYIDALLADLAFDAGLIQGREVDSIFIGGGTPSLFPARQLQRLLAGIEQRIVLRDGLEVTLEANPGTLEAGRYGAYREAGINRLSIGVQSFDARALQRIGRIHTAEDANRAFMLAREAGYQNINLDLMFGLPQQSVDEAGFDLERAVELAPEQISYYQLTLEPNTAFAAFPPTLPPEQLLWEMQQLGHELLARAGYRQYEISAHSKPHMQCRHNLNYWRFGDYLGIGAGAHGKITDPGNQRVTRYARIRGPQAYLAAAGTNKVLTDHRDLAASDLIIEFMLNLMRLKEGFTSRLFQDRTGLDFDRIEQMVTIAEQRDLLQFDGSTVRPTELGQRYLNDLLELFL